MIKKFEWETIKHLVIKLILKNTLKIELVIISKQFVLNK